MLTGCLGLNTAYSQTYETDVFKTKSGKTVTFHALVHASIRIVYDGKEIQIDPVRKLGNKVIDYSAMPKADYLLVTHESTATTSTRRPSKRCRAKRRDSSPTSAVPTCTALAR